MVNVAIRIARKQAGLTQAELAKRAGLHPVSLCRYETGVRDPDLAVLRQLATALQVPLATFIPELVAAAS